MKVMELCDKTMIEVPDEWGETARNIKALIPELKTANTSGRTLYISITSDGACSVSVSNRSEVSVGEIWHHYTEYIGTDGHEYNYVCEYTKEEE